MQALREQDKSTFSALWSRRPAGPVLVHRDMLAAIAAVLLGGIVATVATANPQFIIVTLGGAATAALLDWLAIP